MPSPSNKLQTEFRRNVNIFTADTNLQSILIINVCGKMYTITSHVWNGIRKYCNTDIHKYIQKQSHRADVFWCLIYIFVEVQRRGKENLVDIWGKGGLPRAQNFVWVDKNFLKQERLVSQWLTVDNEPQNIVDIIGVLLRTVTFEWDTTLY